MAKASGPVERQDVAKQIQISVDDIILEEEEDDDAYQDDGDDDDDGGNGDDDDEDDEDDDDKKTQNKVLHEWLQLERSKDPQTLRVTVVTHSYRG